MAQKLPKKYTATQITELNRRFKEVAEAFEEDPKQITALHQDRYIAEKRKQVFDELIVQKRKKKIEQQQPGSEMAHFGEEKTNEVN